MKKGTLGFFMVTSMPEKMLHVLRSSSHISHLPKFAVQANVAMYPGFRTAEGYRDICWQSAGCIWQDRRKEICAELGLPDSSLYKVLGYNVTAFFYFLQNWPAQGKDRPSWPSLWDRGNCIVSVEILNFSVVFQHAKPVLLHHSNASKWVFFSTSYLAGELTVSVNWLELQAFWKGFILIFEVGI